jgi:uncharacterized integral membrane protein (TIGR00698 family)
MKIDRESLIELIIAVLTGTIVYIITVLIKYPVADPLLLSMITGITIRTVTGKKNTSRSSSNLPSLIFIPAGIVFYAARNLNFIKFAKVEISMIILLLVIILVYFTVILILGKLLNQKKQITYLTATGSAICGASAITITSPAVEAEADDVSISLLSVALAAFVGLFVILPFLGILFDVNNTVYSLLSASVLQFTGFVRAAVTTIPYLKRDMDVKDLLSLAMSVKAVKYLGLLIAIPLFASMTKRKFYIPWFLWAFLFSGIISTWFYSVNKIFHENMMNVIEPVYNISWSIAMTSIGLNADISKLLSNNGTKALIMAFAGFIAATGTFFIGLYIIHLF